MANPSTIKKDAGVLLKKDGVILLACPNGTDSARPHNKSWSKLWGESHPNFISDQYLCALFRDYKGIISGDELITEAEGVKHLLKSDMSSTMPHSGSLYMLAQK